MKRKIQDHYHIERALDHLLTTIKRWPVEADWLEAFRSTTKKPEVNKLDFKEDESQYVGPTGLYEICQKLESNVELTEKEQKIYRGAKVIYGEDKIVSMYNKWQTEKIRESQRPNKEVQGEGTRAFRNEQQVFNDDCFQI